MSGTFRKRLATRATEAVMGAGLKVSCVEIRPDGTVLVHTLDQPAKTDESAPAKGAQHNGKPQRNTGADPHKAEERVRALLERAQSGTGH